MLVRYRHALTEKLSIFGKSVTSREIGVGDFKAVLLYMRLVLFSSLSFFSRAFKKPLIGFGKQILFLLWACRISLLHFKGTPWEGLDSPDKLLYQCKSVQFLIKPKLIYFLFILHYLWQSSLWRCISASSATLVCHLFFFLLCFATDKGKKIWHQPWRW